MTSLVRLDDRPLREPSIRGWVEIMAPAAELAKSIAATDFVPTRMRNNPAQIAAAILYGDEVGLGPMVSLSQIAVIEGSPTLLAKAQRALVLAAGHEIWPDELGTTRATWAGRRAGSDQITRVTWSMDDARRAKLAGKQNWVQYPRAMLSARASAELVGAIFADVVGGLLATEEVRDEIEGGEAIAPAPAGAKRRRNRPALAAAGSAEKDSGGSTAPADDLPPLPGEDEAAPLPAFATTHQKNRMHALMRARGISERGDRLRLTTAVIGRVVASSKELTTAEADALLRYLESLPEPEPDPPGTTEQPTLDDQGGT